MRAYFKQCLHTLHKTTAGQRTGFITGPRCPITRDAGTNLRTLLLVLGPHTRNLTRYLLPLTEWLVTSFGGMSACNKVTFESLEV